MLYALNFYINVCSLFLNKTEKKFIFEKHALISSARRNKETACIWGEEGCKILKTIVRVEVTVVTSKEMIFKIFFNKIQFALLSFSSLRLSLEKHFQNVHTETYTWYIETIPDLVEIKMSNTSFHYCLYLKKALTPRDSFFSFLFVPQTVKNVQEF